MAARTGRAWAWVLVALLLPAPGVLSGAHGLGDLRVHAEGVDPAAVRAAIAHVLALDGVLPPWPEAVCASWYCGPDSGSVAPSLSGCDLSSAWIIYQRPVTHPYPPYAFRQAIPTGDESGGICGGKYGIVQEWELVELAAVHPIVLTGFVADGCHGEWRYHADGYCPNSFTGTGLDPIRIPNTFLVSYRARGWGIPLSIDGGTYQMDFFLGLNATECYDLPPGYPADGFACP